MTQQVNLVDIDEVAKHLKVSVSTVRSWLRANLIPENTYIHVGKTYRFDLNGVVFALLNTDLNESVSIIVPDPCISALLLISLISPPGNCALISIISFGFEAE